MWLETAEHGDRDAANSLFGCARNKSRSKLRKGHKERLRKLEELAQIKTEKQPQEMRNIQAWNILRSEYEVAADKGNANAQYLLAKMCAGVEYERLLKLAAQNGQLEAQFELGLKCLSSCQRPKG